MPNPLTAKSETIIISHFSGGDVEKTIETILGEKRSGQLTLHVSQGRVGSVEWREKGPVLRIGEKGILKISEKGA